MQFGVQSMFSLRDKPMPPVRDNRDGLSSEGLSAFRHYSVPAVLLISLGLLLHVAPALPLGLAAAFASLLLAYNFPQTTIVLTVLLGQVAQFELAPLLGLSPEGVALGPVNIRLSDLFVFGMTSSVVIRLAARDSSLVHFIRGEGAFLFLFILYLLFHVAMNVGHFGVSAPGEFRTYYQFLLFVPYVVMSTRLSAQRRSLFKLLIGLSVAHIVWGVLRGSVLYGLTFSAYEKWLSGFGSLAVLYGVFAFAAACRHGVVTPGRVQKAFIYAGSIAMLLISGARAVWFAGVCSGAVLLLQGRITWKQIIGGTAVGGIAIAVTYPLFLLSGLDPVDFTFARLVAFTDFSADPTAAWRYTFWLSTLEEILKSPWFGNGLGLHFDIYVAEFREILTTSPHNLYLSILFHAGLVGLVTYAFWVVAVGIRLKKARPLIEADKAIVSTGFLVLIAVHAYGIAYSFEKDFFTWLFLGLAVSACLHSPSDQELHGGKAVDQ